MAIGMWSYLSSLMLLASCGAAMGARPRIAPRSTPLRKRMGSPFTGDVRGETFEEYLRAQGITFNSLFDEPEETSRADVTSSRTSARQPEPASLPERVALATPTGVRREGPADIGLSVRSRAPASRRPIQNNQLTTRPASPPPPPAPYRRPAASGFYSSPPWRQSLESTQPAQRQSAAGFGSSGAAPLVNSVYPAAEVADSVYPAAPLANSVYPAAEVADSVYPAAEVADSVYPAAEVAAALPPRRLSSAAVRRPGPQRRRTVVALVPAPASAERLPQVLPPPLTPEAAPLRRQDVPERREYVAPLSEPDSTAVSSLGAQASERQDNGYQLVIPEKQEKQRLEFQVHGQKGPHSYRFGYDTGTGYNRQFRFEERDGYGNTRGRYGFYDKSGKLQIVNYSATPEGGFHAEGDFGRFPHAEH